jgi:L-asparagine transporter-like permease
MRDAKYAKILHISAYLAYLAYSAYFAYLLHIWHICCIFGIFVAYFAYLGLRKGNATMQKLKRGLFLKKFSTVKFINDLRFLTIFIFKV